MTAWASGCGGQWHAPGGVAADQQPSQRSHEVPQAKLLDDSTRSGSPGLDGTPAVRGLSVCHSDCKVLDQQNSGPLRRTARRVQSQTGEQRGKRARALTAPWSIRKAMKEFVGGAAQGP